MCINRKITAKAFAIPLNAKILPTFEAIEEASFMNRPTYDLHTASGYARAGFKSEAVDGYHTSRSHTEFIAMISALRNPNPQIDFRMRRYGQKTKVYALNHINT